MAKKAADMLAGLASKATKKEKSKKPKKTRAELPLTDEIRTLASHFIPAKILAKYFSSYEENIKGQLNQVTFAQWQKTLFASKMQPQNPKIVLRKNGKEEDMEFTLVVQERYKVQIPDPENPSESVVELLTRSGLPAKAAKELVDQELDFTPLTTLRPFNELVNGKYENKEFVPATEEEQSVATKLLTYLQWDGEGDAPEPITDEERGLVLRSVTQYKVKPGFLSRVCNYCKNEEQLAAVFQAIKPTIVNRGPKFGVSDPLETRTNRLQEEANKVLGDLEG